jgi:hypothetical protein
MVGNIMHTGRNIYVRDNKERWASKSNHDGTCHIYGVAHGVGTLPTHTEPADVVINEMFPILLTQLSNVLSQLDAEEIPGRINNLDYMLKQILFPSFQVERYVQHPEFTGRQLRRHSEGIQFNGHGFKFSRLYTPKQVGQENDNTAPEATVTLAYVFQHPTNKKFVGTIAIGNNPIYIKDTVTSSTRLMLKTNDWARHALEFQLQPTLTGKTTQTNRASSHDYANIRVVDDGYDFITSPIQPENIQSHLIPYQLRVSGYELKGRLEGIITTRSPLTLDLLRIIQGIPSEMEHGASKLLKELVSERHSTLREILHNVHGQVGLLINEHREFYPQVDTTALAFRG